MRLPLANSFDPFFWNFLASIGTRPVKVANNSTVRQVKLPIRPCLNRSRGKRFKVGSPCFTRAIWAITGLRVARTTALFYSRLTTLVLDSATLGYFFRALIRAPERPSVPVPERPRSSGGLSCSTSIGVALRYCVQFSWFVTGSCYRVFVCSKF